MTRLLIPLVAAVTLALLVVWLLQESQPGSATPRDVAETSARGGISDAAASVAASVSTPEATPDADVAAEAPAAGAAEPEVPSAGSPDAAPPVDAATEPGAAASDPAGEVAADTASASLPAGVVTADAATAYVPEGYAEVEPLAAERRIAFEGAEDVLDAGLDYAAVIETNRGVFVVDLFETATPLTVNNFVFLALHRYFDGIVFHRVIDEFMAQTGDPTGTGTGGPGYRFDDEIVEELRHDGPGVLSMANAGPGTNGSQFFLTFAATPWLDGAHTVFGRIVEGLELLDGITRVDPQQPSVVALLDDPVASVRDQGIDLAGDGTVGEALTAALGAAPVPGPGYDVGGARVAIGTMSGAPAAGFFPYPDRMERVIIVARPRG